MMHSRMKLALASALCSCIYGLAAAGEYVSININEPVANATIHDNSGNLNVSVTVTPQLNSNDGDHFSVQLDGKEISTGTQANMQLANIDRGSHVLRVLVNGRDGTTKISSLDVSFVMWRASILNRAVKK